MFSQVQNYVNEQIQAFAGQAERFGADPLAAFRDGMAQSVDGLKSLRQPVRAAARSGIQFSELSHKTLQELIELQTRATTAALTEIAEGLERASNARDFAALVNAQADALRQSAERVVNDAARALEILAGAGKGMQEIAVETYEKVAKPAEKVAVKTAKPRRTRKAKAKAA